MVNQKDQLRYLQPITVAPQPMSLTKSVNVALINARSLSNDNFILNDLNDNSP